MRKEGIPMSAYRIYFRDQRGWICGRQDFEAAAEPAAIRIARDLADACSDVCRSFELWNGHRLIYEPCDIAEACRLNARHQEIVVRTEEMIRWSDWHIAKSNRLLERLDAAKAPAVAKSQPT